MNERLGHNNLKLNIISLIPSFSFLYIVHHGVCNIFWLPVEQKNLLTTYRGILFCIQWLLLLHPSRETAIQSGLCQSHDRKQRLEHQFFR